MAQRSTTYTGVNEAVVGQKPGIALQTRMLDYGVYKTVSPKIHLLYNPNHNHDDLHQIRLALTLPNKWVTERTTVKALKHAFIKAYRKKHPAARLSRLADDDQTWSLAIKDESLLLFSKKRVDDDAVIAEVFYDRQDVYAMAEWDWAEHDAEIERLRRLIVDDVAHTIRHVRSPPAEITPVTDRKQILPGLSYVLLNGWYRQHCAIVEPDYTISDIKAYLHAKDRLRMPMEALDIGLRLGDEIRVLDSAFTLQHVYEMSVGGGAVAAAADEAVPSADESGGSDPSRQHGALTAPSFAGHTLVLGVGKRVQDRKHAIFLPQVHDPYSFRAPEDKAAEGGTTTFEALPAPKYNGAERPEAAARVNADDGCIVM